MTTTEDKTYNGWTNYETWVVNLWITNDSGADATWREIARGYWEEAENDRPAVWSRSEAARFGLADELKDDVEEHIPEEIGASMYADLLNAAIEEVDWSDIADSFLADCKGYERQD